MKMFRWLVAGLWLNAGILPAETYTTVYNFTNYEPGSPSAGVVWSGNAFYGVITYNRPTVFQVNADGTGYAALPCEQYSGSGSAAGLLLSGNVLYGVGKDFVVTGYTDVTNFSKYATPVNNTVNQTSKG
jgi:hypothetical protein